MWRWVKGHAGHPQNEYANDLAIRAATKQINSEGLVESGFDDWIARQQENKKFLAFRAVPPDEAGFKPARALPRA
jgi:ribonuclease HI